MFGGSEADAPNLEKGFDASVGLDCGVASLFVSAELAGNADKKEGCALGKPLDWEFSDWEVCEKIPELIFGAALNSPPWVVAGSVVFAGCGVLKPLKRLFFGASGAFKVDVPEDFLLLLAAGSEFCVAPKRLNPVVGAAGVAAGLLLGFPKEANRLGVSVVALLLGSAGFMLPNRLFEGVCAFSSALGVCVVESKGLNRDDEDVLGAVGRLANGLLADVLAGVNAGALGVAVAALESPNRLVDGAVAVLAAGVAPKLNKLLAGAVLTALSVACALVPKPLKMLLVGVVVSVFCVFAPKPLKILFGASAAGCAAVLSPPKRLLAAGVLVLF